MDLTNIVGTMPYHDFLNNYKSKLKTAFYERADLTQFIQRRGFPSLVWREIMSAKPLSVSIPKKYGGRGINVKECLGVFEASGYESLALSLTFGINFALFMEPVAKYGSESLKPKVFERFLNQANMGGLMITEPGYGSDALNMQTFNVKEGSNYKIKGIKHWQGLTGLADYWLMTSRSKSESGKLSRDIDFFVTDEQVDAQRIIVDELYNSAGLYPIPYGKNIVDVTVPDENKLIPESTGLKLMMDLLHRSRFQFPGMGMGFIKRNLDECLKQCTTRIVGTHPLIAMDQVQHMIGRVQSAFVICSAFCKRSSEISSIDNNLALMAIEANTMKAYVTDLMQESAQITTQLYGAKGYLEESFGQRGITDSRPFRIFEGSNEMLYTQISEMTVKTMIRGKQTNLAEYLKTYELSEKVADRYKDILNFDVENKMPQRKLVDLGQIISRVLSAQMVVSLGESGFRPDLIEDTLTTLKHDITMLLSSYKYNTAVSPTIEYQAESWWMDYC